MWFTQSKADPVLPLVLRCLLSVHLPGGLSQFVGFFSSALYRSTLLGHWLRCLPSGLSTLLDLWSPRNI
ncbi:unnamed protein product [Merluccius merluccius]